MISIWQMLYLLEIRQTPIATLFPYTTLFRSGRRRHRARARLGGIYARLRRSRSAGGDADQPLARVSVGGIPGGGSADRKSTRLNSSHGYISYAVFCLKKKSMRNIT